MGVFLKKLFRLLIAVFCIFFALRLLPAGSLSVLSPFWQGTETLLQEISGLVFSTENDRSSPGPASDAPDPDVQDDPASSADAESDTDRDADNKEADSAGRQEDQGEAKAEDPSAAAHEGADREGDADAAEPGPAEEENPPADTAEPEPAPPGPVSEDRIVYYYYTRISPEERLLYDAMLALARDPEGTGEESRLIGMDPSSEEFSVSYTRAFNALVSDHPELFWISMARASYQCRYYILPAFGGQYKVVFSLQFEGEDSSSAEELRSRYGAEEQQLREARDSLLGQVDFTQSQAGIALQIHDLLLDRAWYNRGAGTDDYAHSAYGALVADSSGNPGGALCDGYSLAYQYLLQHAGLTCAMVSGYAGPSEEDLEKHAWNIVLLDEDWYEVDSTWDDIVLDISPDEEGYDILNEALSDQTYMQRIRHYMYNRTTEQMRSFTPGEEYRYSSDNGWVTLLQPSVHIRFGEEDSEQTRDYITPLAPTAEGTLYTWDMLAGVQ